MFSCYHFLVLLSPLKLEGEAETDLFIQSWPTSSILNWTASLGYPSLSHLKIMTLWSWEQIPYSRATFRTREISLSVCWIKWAGTLYPMTPRQALTYRTVEELTEQARIMACGRYRASSLARWPLSVITTMRATLLSRASSMAYELRISVMEASFPSSAVSYLAFAAACLWS